MKYILVVLFALLTSCNGQKRVSDENTGQGANLKAETSLTLLLQDNYSGAETAENLVIRDAKTLNKFFSKVNRTRKPGLPVPEVDFSKELVIIYCGGVQSENGSLSLSMKEETEGKMLFEPVYQTSKNDRQTGVATSPFCVYSIRFTEKEIVFTPAK